MLVLGERRCPPDDDDNDDAWAMVHPRETQQSVFTSIVGAAPRRALSSAVRGGGYFCFGGFFAAELTRSGLSLVGRVSDF